MSKFHVQLRAGDKVQADFTGGSKRQDLDDGRLIGEIQPGLWVIDFAKRGLITAGIETKESFGADEAVEMLDGLALDDLIINPTSPTDWAEEDMTIILQLSAGKVLNPDLDVEGGLFPLILIGGGDDE